VAIHEIDRDPRSYAQGALVEHVDQVLFVSGQVPIGADGTVPEGFAAQCRQAWANLISVVEKAGMTQNDLVKVTVFLSDRRYREENARIRHEVLGGHSPALTIIITGIYDEEWLLEIEGVAATSREHLSDQDGSLTEGAGSSMDL